jgi:hypothetical protein
MTFACSSRDAAIFEDIIADLDMHENASQFLMNNYRDGVVPTCDNMARYLTVLALAKRFQVVCKDVEDKLSFMQMPQSLKSEYADRILAKLAAHKTHKAPFKTLHSPTAFPLPLAKISPSMTTLPIISRMPKAAPHPLTTPPLRPAPLVAERPSALEARYDSIVVNMIRQCNAAQARIAQLENRLTMLESTSVHMHDTATRVSL